MPSLSILSLLCVSIRSQLSPSSSFFVNFTAARERGSNSAGDYRCSVVCLLREVATLDADALPPFDALGPWFSPRCRNFSIPRGRTDRAGGANVGMGRGGRKRDPRPRQQDCCEPAKQLFASPQRGKESSFCSLHTPWASALPCCCCCVLQPAEVALLRVVHQVAAAASPCCGGERGATPPYCRRQPSQTARPN